MGAGLFFGLIVGFIILVLFFGMMMSKGFATAYLVAAANTKNRVLRFLAGAGGAVAGIVGGLLFIIVSMVIMEWRDGGKYEAKHEKQTSSPARPGVWHTMPAHWQLRGGRTMRFEISGGPPRLVDESGSTIDKLGAEEAIGTSVVSDQGACLLLMVNGWKALPGGTRLRGYDHLLRVVQDASGHWHVSRVLPSPAQEGMTERPIVLDLASVSDDGSTARLRVHESGSSIRASEWQTRSLDNLEFEGNRLRK